MMKPTIKYMRIIGKWLCFDYSSNGYYGLGQSKEECYYDWKRVNGK